MEGQLLALTGCDTQGVLSLLVDADGVSLRGPKQCKRACLPLLSPAFCKAQHEESRNRAVSRALPPLDSGQIKTACTPGCLWTWAHLGAVAQRTAEAQHAAQA